MRSKNLLLAFLTSSSSSTFSSSMCSLSFNFFYLRSILSYHHIFHSLANILLLFFIICFSFGGGSFDFSSVIRWFAIPNINDDQPQGFIAERLQNRYFANNWHVEPILDGRWEATSWRKQGARHNSESRASRRCSGRCCKLKAFLCQMCLHHKLP